ncbi:unnamed protein product [Urochloa decumbens]|uniref:Dof zinc finger protein n=1 Tax=Urochloa decumbens TaxID=240449 RepID=A0ABC8WR25_9POAL
MDSISSNTTARSALQTKQEVVASPAAAAGSRNMRARQQQQADRPRPEQEKGLLCPRCPSTNTKFCYYNNYSVTQPRYFCKACRRYWTLGGTLRSVPVGGGCRKNKQQQQQDKLAADDDSATATKKKKMDDISQHLMMMPTATAPMPADFPNVLPTFMSTNNPTGGLLPFPGTTFLDMLPFLPAAPPSFGVMLSQPTMLQGGVDQQEVKPTMPAGAGGAAGASVQEEPSADNNNNDNMGGGAGSIINYWQL